MKYDRDEDGNVTNVPTIPEFEQRLRAAHDAADDSAIADIMDEYNRARKDRIKKDEAKDDDGAGDESTARSSRSSSSRSRSSSARTAGGDGGNGSNGKKGGDSK